MAQAIGGQPEIQKYSLLTSLHSIAISLGILDEYWWHIVFIQKEDQTEFKITTSHKRKNRKYHYI